MFYKHWKKIALTLTALFWASCSETHEEAVLYGCPPDGCYDEPLQEDEKGACGQPASICDEDLLSRKEAFRITRFPRF